MIFPWTRDSFDDGYEMEEETAMLITEETYQLFVGVETGDGYYRRIETVKRVLNAHLEGWTLHVAVGSWKGKEEAAVVITTSTNYGAVVRTANDLADRLNQEAVGVVKIGEAMEFRP